MSRNYIGKKKKGIAGLLVFCLMAFALTFVISIVANSGFMGADFENSGTELDELFASEEIVNIPEIKTPTQETPKETTKIYQENFYQESYLSEPADEPEDIPDGIEVSATPEKAVVPIVGGSVIKGYSSEVEYSSVYEDWRSHTAVDIAGEKGAQINAVAGGIVVESYIDSACGGVIKIDHGAFYSVYMGLEPETMEMNGTTVKAGDVIAHLQGEIMGESANPHLHFEIIENDIYTDPMKYIG